MKFELRSKEIGAIVRIYFDFDNYVPEKMKAVSAGLYQLYKMIPPGPHHYFFTVN